MNAGIQLLQEKRSPRKLTYFMTGITSFLGSHLAIFLLNQGYRMIFLCRSKRDIESHRRVKQILNWFKYYKEDSIKVVEGYINEINFGLDKDTYQYLVENTDEVIHCASETSFSLDKMDLLKNINITGTKHVIELAEKAGCLFFHYLSTAYSAGKKEGHVLENYYSSDKFHNYYEKSKNIAEAFVIERCRKSKIVFSIIRPSIVYGDSVTGKSLRFNALYYPVRIFNYLKTKFMKDYETNDGKNAHKMGVKMNKNGKIIMPIRLLYEEGGSLNLIPIDYFVKTTGKILQNNFKDGIFHIILNETNKITLPQLIHYVNRYLDIEGIITVDQTTFDAEPLSPLEKLFDSYVSMYKPYFNDKRVFKEDCARKFTSDKILCPLLDYESFKRLMDFAIATNWGKNIFDGIEIPQYTPVSWLVKKTMDENSEALAV